MFVLRDSASGELRVRVWQQQQGRTYLIHDEPVSSFERSRVAGEPHRLTLASGEQWQIVKQGGCGCGSPLRRLNWRKEA